MQGINKQGQFIINKGNSAKDVYNHIYANGDLPKFYGDTVKTVYEDYTNFHFERAKSTANAWWFFNGVSFPFIVGGSYLYRCWVRCNSCNIPIYLRAARGENDWKTTTKLIAGQSLSDGLWHEYYIILNNMPSEYTLNSSTTRSTKPVFEAYSDNLNGAYGDPVIIDFDIKNIEVVPTDAYIPYTALLEDTSNVKMKKNMIIANSFYEI